MTLIINKEDPFSYEFSFYDQQLNSYIINRTNGEVSLKAEPNFLMIVVQTPFNMMGSYPIPDTILKIKHATLPIL